MDDKHEVGTEDDTTQADALQYVKDERDRQDAEFGKQEHDPAYWLAILGKQTGQLGEAVVQHKWSGPFAKAMLTHKMYNECAQVAAVAVAMMEAIARGEIPDEITTARPRDSRQLARALDRGHENLNYDETVGAEVHDTELPGEKISRQQAEDESTPMLVPAHLKTQEEKVAFRKDWDRRVEEGQS